MKTRNMATKKIDLVGTVDLDLNGPLRIWNLLERKFAENKSSGLISLEAPSLLTKREVRELYFQNREKEKEIVLKSSLPENFKDLLLEFSESRGYELLVPLEYCEKRGAGYVFVDHPEAAFGIEADYDSYGESLEDISRSLYEHLRNVPYPFLREAITGETDRAYYNPKVLEELDAQLAPAAHRMAASFQRSSFGNGFMETREQYLAENILESDPDLHLGEMAHIYRNHGKALSVKPLFRRLGRKAGKRLRLCNESSNELTA